MRKPRARNIIIEIVLKEVSGLQEFKELASVPNKVVYEKRLEEVLDLMSGKGGEPED